MIATSGGGRRHNRVAAAASSNHLGTHQLGLVKERLHIAPAVVATALAERTALAG